MNFLPRYFTAPYNTINELNFIISLREQGKVRTVSHEGKKCFWMRSDGRPEVTAMPVTPAATDVSSSANYYCPGRSTIF